VRKLAKASTGAFAVTALLLTGCGAGPDAETRLIKQVTDGIEANIGDLRMVNVLLVAQPDGSAVLVGTVVNNGTKQSSAQTRLNLSTDNALVGALIVPSIPSETYMQMAYPVAPVQFKKDQDTVLAYNHI